MRAFLAHPAGTGGICWDVGKPCKVVGRLKNTYGRTPKGHFGAAMGQSHTKELPLPNTQLVVELLLATGCGQRWGCSGVL